MLGPEIVIKFNIKFSKVKGPKCNIHVIYIDRSESAIYIDKGVNTHKTMFFIEISYESHCVAS